MAPQDEPPVSPDSPADPHAEPGFPEERPARPPAPAYNARGISGGMWVGIASVVFTAAVGVVALLAAGGGAGAPDEVAGRWDLGGGVELCLDPAGAEGGAVRGVIRRAAWQAAVAGTRSDAALEAALSRGAASVGTLSATLTAGGRRGLSGVLRLTDPAGGLDLVLRFDTVAPAASAAASCGPPPPPVPP